MEPEFQVPEEVCTQHPKQVCKTVVNKYAAEEQYEECQRCKREQREVRDFQSVTGKIGVTQPLTGVVAF